MSLTGEALVFTGGVATILGAIAVVAARISQPTDDTFSIFMKGRMMMVTGILVTSIGSVFITAAAPHQQLR